MSDIHNCKGDLQAERQVIPETPLEMGLELKIRYLFSRRVRGRYSAILSTTISEAGLGESAFLVSRRRPRLPHHSCVISIMKLSKNEAENAHHVSPSRKISSTGPEAAAPGGRRGCRGSSGRRFHRCPEPFPQSLRPTPSSIAPTNRRRATAVSCGCRRLPESHPAATAQSGGCAVPGGT